MHDPARLSLQALDSRVTPATFTVTTGTDDGPGSFRQAILDSNATQGPDTIAFNIGGGGVQTIRPTAALPTVTDPVVIDGTTQPGYAGAPIVVLNGSQAGRDVSGLTITAGDSIVRGLVITSYYYASGIVLAGAGGNRVVGNYIGTDVTGQLTLDFQVGGSGVAVLGGAGNVIGGPTATDRNVISTWTATGVLVTTNDTTVQGNYIGIDATGTRGLVPGGTGDVGVLVAFVERNTIVGNVIGDCQAAISVNAGDGHRIQGNFIGTDVTGTVALGNAVGIAFGGNRSLIGGPNPADRNLVSGSTHTGISVGGLGNRVEGNYVGTDVTGTKALGNVIGIAAAGAIVLPPEPVVVVGNLVSGNTVYGIDLDGRAEARGNFIGTDLTGTKALPNGIGIQAGGGVVGGLTAADGNLISGNTVAGVEYAGSDLLGNRIGTDVTGTKALGNGVGIRLMPNPSGYIGRSVPGAGNLISGNKGDGIVGRANGLQVEGNWIGTDATGTVALGNGGHGISFPYAESIFIGGPAGAGNVIAGNKGHGINLGDTSSHVRVEGNFIGTDATGTDALGNAGHGIYVKTTIGFGSNFIGGTAAGTGNVISGNALDGVRIDGPVGGKFAVYGNRIGTDAGGTAAVPNRGNGVVANGGSGLVIGSAAFGASNTVAFNRRAGVVIQGGMAVGNRIQGNAIFSNGRLGIDLGNDGVTPNDPGDRDKGPNRRQNFPALVRALSGTSTRITGALNSAPDTTFTVDFYASPADGSDARGEGARYLGSVAATTDATGRALFEATLAGRTAPGEQVTATATDPTGNTSEFSAAALVYRPVTLDIQPGDPTNTVDLTGSGVLAVAVLTTPDFDAATVDTTALSRLRFGDAGRTARVSPERETLGDVDGDGDLDRVLIFSLRTVRRSGALTAATSAAALTGFTFGGTAFYGDDAVSVTGPG
jgi:hypothetical protein